MMWCGSPGEAGDRQVEAAPKEMYWARLAEKARSKMGERLVRREQHAPEASGVIAIVSDVQVVLIEGNGTSDLARHRRDPHIEPEFGHCIEQFGIELGDKHRPEQELAEFSMAQFVPTARDRQNRSRFEMRVRDRELERS